MGLLPLCVQLCVTLDVRTGPVCPTHATVERAFLDRDVLREVNAQS